MREYALLRRRFGIRPHPALPKVTALAKIPICSSKGAQEVSGVNTSTAEDSHEFSKDHTPPLLDESRDSSGADTTRADDSQDIVLDTAVEPLSASTPDARPTRDDSGVDPLVRDDPVFHDMLTIAKIFPAKVTLFPYLASFKQN